MELKYREPLQFQVSQVFKLDHYGIEIQPCYVYCSFIVIFKLDHYGIEIREILCLLTIMVLL